jgi:hypothetical protein
MAGRVGLRHQRPSVPAPGPNTPWTRVNALPVVAAIKRFRPTAIVCTHFLPAQLVASLLLCGVIDARTAVVTTDYDFHGLWLTGAFHALFLAREEGRMELMALGVPPDRLAATPSPPSRVTGGTRRISTSVRPTVRDASLVVFSSLPKARRARTRKLPLSPKHFVGQDGFRVFLPEPVL